MSIGGKTYWYNC